MKEEEKRGPYKRIKLSVRPSSTVAAYLRGLLEWERQSTAAGGPLCGPIDPEKRKHLSQQQTRGK